MGKYPACSLCYDGTYPQNPAMVINMLYLWTDSCRNYYEHGERGRIPTHLCGKIEQNLSCVLACHLHRCLPHFFLLMLTFQYCIFQIPASLQYFAYEPCGCGESNPSPGPNAPNPSPTPAPPGQAPGPGQSPGPGPGQAPGPSPNTEDEDDDSMFDEVVDFFCGFIPWPC